ncbi:hypothetical protein [Pseudomonas sp. NPDC089734]|uniref:hypothetical protein n=1 Tax=Pseudomonas sp. NPDC089734 TaxID=3364469 RepID=UPI00380462D2
MKTPKRWLLSALILLSGLAQASDRLMYQAVEPARLSAGSYTVHLKAVGAETDKPDLNGRWTLKLSGIWAAGKPSSPYGLYLNLPPGTQPTPEDPGYVGTLSVYDTPRRYDPQRSRKVSYDLLPAFSRLKASGRLKMVSTLTLLPVRPPESAQTLHIQQVEIYRNTP